MTLDKLHVGQSGIIRSVGGEGPLRLRLLDMGVIPKTHVTVTRIAPMGDPVEVFLRGYTLSLRLEDAAMVDALQTISIGILRAYNDTRIISLVCFTSYWIIGLPLGLLLAVTDQEGLRPNASVNKTFGTAVNLLRSVPFQIQPRSHEYLSYLFLPHDI